MKYSKNLLRHKIVRKKTHYLFSMTEHNANATAQPKY